jgi:stage IV sporulation protein FB
MFDVGYLTVARWKGTPIRIHWSTPLGMLLFGRFQLVPGFWLGYLVIVGLHEMGHAHLSRRMGLRATSIEIHALGGQCRYGGASVSPWQRAVVAWGGVLAQAMLLVPAVLVSVLVSAPGDYGAQFLSALTWTNVWLMALNLMPIAPLDGAEAWRLPRLWRARRGRRGARAARERVEVRVPPSRKPEGGPLALGEVDEAAVRETVRRALADAARDSKRKRDVS